MHKVKNVVMARKLVHLEVKPSVRQQIVKGSEKREEKIFGNTFNFKFWCPGFTIEICSKSSYGIFFLMNRVFRKYYLPGNANFKLKVSR